MSTAKPIERTMQYVRRKGIVRPRDLDALGIPREYCCVSTVKESGAELDARSILCQTRQSRNATPTQS
jgi:hypothetical protein